MLWSKGNFTDEKMAYPISWMAWYARIKSQILRQPQTFPKPSKINAFRDSPHNSIIVPNLLS